MRIFLYKTAYFLITSWLLSSCTCDVEPTRPSSPYIYYRDNKGQDLLNPSMPGYFGQNGLTISYMNPDGTKGSQSVSAFKLPGSSTVPYLPNGYYLSINPFLIDYNGNNGIVTGNTCIVYIQLSTSDADTLIFDYSSQTLVKFFYNKTLINPPTGMSSYPLNFPVMVTK